MLPITRSDGSDLECSTVMTAARLLLDCCSTCVGRCLSPGCMEQRAHNGAGACGLGMLCLIDRAEESTAEYQGQTEQAVAPVTAEFHGCEGHGSK